MITKQNRHIIATLLVWTMVVAIMFFALVVDAQSSTGLKNPLDPALSSIPTFISGFLKVIVMVALPIISLFIVYSGFLFVTARGNETKLSNAKNNFFYVIIGAILILGAWVIATMIAGTVSQLTTG